MAEQACLPCETVIASIREPSDFAGLPIVEDGRSVRFAPPRWAERLAEAGHGILFLDEISTAPPAVQAALLRVVLERTVGDLALPDGVTVVAAANPPEQAADGWDLSAPLANRFCHLDWELTASEWADGIIGGFDAAAIPTFDPDRFSRTLTETRGSLGAFISSRPALLAAPPTNPADAGRAWPSPRSWEMGARLLTAAGLSAQPEVVTGLLMAGAVGPAAAAEYLAWREDLELPDPEVVLGNPADFRLPDRGDKAYAALALVTAAVLGNNTPDRWQAAWQAIAAGTRNGHADIAVAAIRSLVTHRPDGAVPPREVLAALAPVLKTAGMFERLAASNA
jgi:hypothetical protein